MSAEEQSGMMIEDTAVFDFLHEALGVTRLEIMQNTEPEQFRDLVRTRLAQFPQRVHRADQPWYRGFDPDTLPAK